MIEKSDDYEGEMARNTLKKLIVFSTEILPLIQEGQQLPAWLQDKFSKLDYYINSVYSYIKFSESQRQEAESSNEMEEDSDEMEEEMELEVSLPNTVKK